MSTLAAAFSAPRRIVTALTRRAASVTLPTTSRDADEGVPLHPFRIDDEDSDDEDASLTPGSGGTGATRRAKRVAPGTPPPPTSAAYKFTKRGVILILSFLALYSLGTYLYSDPERWPKSWRDTILGSSTTPFPSLVTAGGRRYQGEEVKGGKVIAWRGIKYAKPPTGERRFRRAVPMDVPRTNGGPPEAVDATKHDQGCPRPNPDGSEGYVGVEDCLSLNIHTPKRRLPGMKLPVMVWIHGGGFYGGASNEDRYNPKDLLERSQRMNQPFIYVSISYRLHALGFSASPPVPGPPPSPPHIPTSPPDELDLNVGLKDQLLALEWIRKEIGNWGGDPDKVTLVGHSAGAISVGLHQLYSPPELFRGAFMLSGAPTSFPVPFPHDGAARTIHPLVEPAGCPGASSREGGGPPSTVALVDCLRALPLDALMRSCSRAFDFTFGAIEGILEPIWSLYPDDPIIGSPFQTGNETFGLAPSFKRAAAILGDVFFQAPRRHFLRETPKDFGEPSWNFLYDEKRPAQHGADLESWFGHPNSDDSELHHLSRHMTAYLINFVANLDPNGPGLRVWPQYGMDRRTLHLGRHNITVTHDNARLEPMRFINDNNPLFAR
ncbi:hypothetical protein RQP46_009306 [Phenoliferia psychrophenolica]